MTKYNEIKLLGVDNTSVAIVTTSGALTTQTSLVSGSEIKITDGTYDVVLTTSGAMTTATQFISELGVPYGIKHVNNKPRVSAMPYLYDIAEGNVPGHIPFVKIGFNSAITTTEEDVWSSGALYVFPTAAMGMEVRSSSATADADIGTILFDATCDVGGTATSMIAAGVDFTATAVAGDIIIIDKAGAVPEYGVLTAVANGSVTFSGGLSEGGSCATARTYQILDVSAATGAMAIWIRYLNGSYVEKAEIVILNTTTVVPTVNTDIFRINYVEVIVVGTKAGAKYAPVGNIEVRNLADTPIYGHITAGFTRARQCIYTVPSGMTLYIVQATVGAATNNDDKIQTCRVITKNNASPEHSFKGAGNIFYPLGEFLISNSTETVEMAIPTKFIEKTDIKASAIGLTGFSGPVSIVLRGWLE